MRTLRTAGLTRIDDLVLFPDGTIKNQGDTEEGTPVVREVYGDILTNAYALLRDTGIVANNQEDNENNGYQILKALKRLANELNDIEQVLTINGSQVSVNFNIDSLPDKYAFIARASEAYNDSVNYTFKGTGDNSYLFSSTNSFSSGDQVLVVIDQSGVRAVGLNPKSQELSIFTVFGAPIAYNDSAQLYYGENGKIFTDIPTIADLQSAIRNAEGNGTLYVYDTVVIQGHVLCLCWISDVQTYKFYQFSINDLEVAQPVNISGITIPVGSNNEPYLYTGSNFVYLTNEAGTTANDNELASFSYDPGARILTLSSSLTLDANFTKTTNAAVVANDLVSFLNGQLKKYSLTAATEQDLGTYDGILGQLFIYNGDLYYSNGEVAKKWTV
ncbi:MAG: hypothetical protein AAGH46_06495 [Bacteroidota bacterium]